jgi:hypothetical protein
MSTGNIGRRRKLVHTESGKSRLEENGNHFSKEKDLIK